MSDYHDGCAGARRGEEGVSRDYDKLHHEFGVSGDDAQPGEPPGNFLLRLICEREKRHASEVERAVAEVKSDWENAIQHERMQLADDPKYAQDAVIFALKTRHAREIEKARGLLMSLVKHLELSVGEGAKLSTTYRLATAALAALEVGK